MPQAVVKISEDKAFFKTETPDAHWEAEQINEDGLNFLHDAEEADGPIYLVVTDYESDDGPKPNMVYLLVPLDTTVIPNSNLEDDPGPEPADEPAN